MVLGGGVKGGRGNECQYRAILGMEETGEMVGKVLTG